MFEELFQTIFILEIKEKMVTNKSKSKIKEHSNAFSSFYQYVGITNNETNY